MSSPEHQPTSIIFASGHVGFECLSYLLDGQEDIKKVMIGSSDDVNILALTEMAGIPVEVCNAKSLNNLVSEGVRYDWLLNLWCPHILKPDVLNLARRRLNVHPGLVPHCRGNDGAAWALRQNLPAGVSLIEMTEGIDEGDIYVQKQVFYNSGDTGRTLHQKLLEEAVRLFKNEWPAIRKEETGPIPQSGDGSYFTRKMTDTDRIKDGSEVTTVKDIINWATAHDFSPGTTAEVKNVHGKRYRLRIEEI